MNKATCTICDTEILIIPDNTIRYCRCKCLGVNCFSDNAQVEYIGVIVPKEHKNYAEWYKKHKLIIEAERNRKLVYDM